MLLTDKSQKQIEFFLRYRSAGDSIRNKSKSIVRFFMVPVILSVAMNAHAQGLTASQFAEFMSSPEDMALAQRFGLEMYRINSCITDIQSTQGSLYELIENYDSADVFELTDEQQKITESLQEIKANCDVSIYDGGLPRNPLAKNKFMQRFLNDAIKAMVGLNQVITDLIHFLESSLNSSKAGDWESFDKYAEQSGYSNILLSEYLIEYNETSMLATVENSVPAGVLLVTNGQLRIILGLELIQLKYFQEAALDNETRNKSVSSISRGERDLLSGLKPLSKAVGWVLEMSDVFDHKLSLTDRKLLDAYQAAAQKMTNSAQVMVNDSRKLRSWIDANLEVGRRVDLDTKEYQSIEADLMFNSAMTVEALQEFNLVLPQVQQAIQRIINS